MTVSFWCHCYWSWLAQAMGFQGFKHSAEPKGRSRPMQLAKAFQVCPCCSVTPAHSPLPLSTGRQAFDLDLHVWHIRQGPGLGSLRSETQECQRDCLADTARAEPSLTLSFIWIKAKDEIWGYGGRRMRDMIEDLLTNSLQRQYFRHFLGFKAFNA